jgi:hypothetical protein
METTLRSFKNSIRVSETWQIKGLIFIMDICMYNRKGCPYNVHEYNNVVIVHSKKNMYF